MSRIWFLLAGKVILFFYIQDCNSTVSVVEYYSSLFWCSCAFVCSITAEQRMKHDIHGAASPGSSSIVCLWRKIIYQQIVVYRSGKLSAIEAECVVWDIVTTRSASLAWPSLVLLRKWKSRHIRSHLYWILCHALYHFTLGALGMLSKPSLMAVTSTSHAPCGRRGARFGNNSNKRD